MRRYRCDDCSREFLVPEDSPRHMDGLTDEEAPGALSCPWCDDVAREVEA